MPRTSPAIMWSAGRDRVVTRGRGICLPSILLPPSAPTSYHKKVTSVAKEQRGMRGFSFRESATPEARFPRMSLLGSSVKRGHPLLLCRRKHLGFGVPRHESYYRLLHFALKP